MLLSAIADIFHRLRACAMLLIGYYLMLRVYFFTLIITRRY